MSIIFIILSNVVALVALASSAMDFQGNEQVLELMRRSEALSEEAITVDR